MNLYQIPSINHQFTIQTGDGAPLSKYKSPEHFPSLMGVRFLSSQFTNTLSGIFPPVHHVQNVLLAFSRNHFTDQSVPRHYWLALLSFSSCLTNAQLTDSKKICSSPSQESITNLYFPRYFLPAVCLIVLGHNYLLRLDDDVRMWYRVFCPSWYSLLCKLHWMSTKAGWSRCQGVSRPLCD